MQSSPVQPHVGAREQPYQKEPLPTICERSRVGPLCILGRTVRRTKMIRCWYSWYPYFLPPIALFQDVSRGCEYGLLCISTATQHFQGLLAIHALQLHHVLMLIESALPTLPQACSPTLLSWPLLRPFRQISHEGHLCRHSALLYHAAQQARDRSQLLPGHPVLPIADAASSHYLYTFGVRCQAPAIATLRFDWPSRLLLLFLLLAVCISLVRVLSAWLPFAVALFDSRGFFVPKLAFVEDLPFCASCRQHRAINVLFRWRCGMK
mmetsp:Transcript_40534/g.84356  ORF Transcript_40534/g.84356 Transcript_40534/m.84356 type:complete len:265 (+) Transcript_40534:2376-3170(+)